MSGFWDGYPELATQLEEVRQAIREKARSDDSEVQASVGQLLESNGKMLRPAFVILASRFGSPAGDRVQRIAAAIEMLHMATLAHDDIIDNAALRRGVATPPRAARAADGRPCGRLAFRLLLLHGG